MSRQVWPVRWRRGAATDRSGQAPAPEPSATHSGDDTETAGRDRALEHLVLHVGVHKTGSTLLQKMLRASASELRDADYAVVPPPGFRKLLGEPPQLWRQTMTSRHIETAARNFRREWSESNLVLSNEEFMGPIASFRKGAPYPEAGNVLRQTLSAFGPERATIVLYVRRQDSFIESAYLQLVKMGWVDVTFEEFLAQLDVTALDWSDLVRRIEDVLPDNATLRVKYFESIKTLGGDEFCRDFAREIDPDFRPVLEFDTDGSNRGYSDVAMRIALAANSHLDGEDKKKLRGFLDKHFTNVTHPKPVLFDDAGRRDVLEKLAESNGHLHRRIDGATGDPLYLAPLRERQNTPS